VWQCSVICSQKANYLGGNIYYLNNQNILLFQCQCNHFSVIQTTGMILSAIDKKQLTAVVLLDMSKAFDSINHNMLLVKLHDVGASPSAIKWFRSYLTSRYQVVIQSEQLFLIVCKWSTVFPRRVY